MSIYLQAPLAGAELEKLEELKAGDRILLNGVIYAARDAAHRRMAEALKEGGALPFPLEGAIMFYAGPTPASEGRPAGSIGPTTAARMDPFTVPLLERGLKGAIGKGPRSPEVKEAFVRCGAVYLVAVGGVAALLGSRVRASELVAYPELGPEAILRLQVVQMPLFVAYDLQGGDIFGDGEGRNER